MSQEELNPEVQEEVLDSVPEQAAEEVVSEEVTEPSSYEADPNYELAKKYGWDPNKGTKTPTEFVLTGENIGLKNQLRQVETKLQRIVDWQTKVDSRQVEQTERMVAKQLREAEENYDVEAVKRLTETKLKIENYKQNAQAMEQMEPPLPAEAQAVFNNWAVKNPWIQDPSYFKVAHEIEQNLMAQNSALNCKEYPENTALVLSQIETRMKSYYPHLFEGRRESVSSTVPVGDVSVNRGVAARGPVAKEFTSLTRDQKELYKTLNEYNPKFTTQDFIKQLKDYGEI